MKTQPDFYNKTAKVLMEKYFPQVKWHHDNKYSQKMIQALEDFNNGCLTYGELIRKVTKETKDSEINIENLLDKFIISQ